MKRIVILCVCFFAQSLSGMEQDHDSHILNDLSEYLHGPVTAMRQSQKLPIHRNRKKVHRALPHDALPSSITNIGRSRGHQNSPSLSSSDSSLDSSINTLIEYANIRNITRWLTTSDTQMMQDFLFDELQSLRKKKEKIFNQVVALIPKDVKKEIPSLTISLLRLALRAVQRTAEDFGGAITRDTKKIKRLTAIITDRENEIMSRDRAIREKTEIAEEYEQEIESFREKILQDYEAELTLCNEQVRKLREEYAAYVVNEHNRRRDCCQIFSCYAGCFARNSTHELDEDLVSEWTDAELHEDGKSDVDDIQERI